MIFLPNAFMLNSALTTSFTEVGQPYLPALIELPHYKLASLPFSSVSVWNENLFDIDGIFGFLLVAGDCPFSGSFMCSIRNSANLVYYI
jgi:hypothetical protein